MSKAKGPVVVEIAGEEPALVLPADAPAVPGSAGGEAARDDALGSEAALGRVVRVAARPPSRIWRLVLGALGGLAVLVLSLAAWDFALTQFERSPVLGGVATFLMGVVLAGAVAWVLREGAGFVRLRRIDQVQRAARMALDTGDLAAARDVSRRLVALYRGRADLAWHLARFREGQGDPLDAASLLALAEDRVMAPIDRAARSEIEAAARQVATVTAVVPLALADVAGALVVNARMIRRIATLYGGRAGALGNWRLVRAVFAHLVATGAVAVGDDLIGSVAGGGLIGKLSRRFGEGIVNGALTARVGVAAIEVCRPLPHIQATKPSVSGLVRRALAGLF